MGHVLSQVYLGQDMSIWDKTGSTEKIQAGISEANLIQDRAT